MGFCRLAVGYWDLASAQSANRLNEFTSIVDVRGGN
jgi:hypothetical protein